MNPQKYVFFDFDNTLAKGDSVIPFLFFCLKGRYTSVCHLFRIAGAWIVNRIHQSDNLIPVKETTFSFLKGMSQADIDCICIDFVDRVLSKRLYAQGIAEMRRLKDQGYKVCVVSASSDLYMKHISRILPVDYVISTECKFSDGKYTGTMGPNCKGEEKKRRILETFNKLPCPDHCICYGDSESDAPMLDLGHIQCLVNPHGNSLTGKYPNAEIKKWKVKRK